MCDRKKQPAKLARTFFSHSVAWASLSVPANIAWNAFSLVGSSLWQAAAAARSVQLGLGQAAAQPPRLLMQRSWHPRVATYSIPVPVMNVLSTTGPDSAIAGSAMCA